jgi:F-box protein 11
MPDKPAAFMSYVRFNDQHDDGQLTLFRERLSTEVQAQTGEEFSIFQDRNDIAWGQNWQQRIDEALDAVTLLLVIVTPSLFRSPACRAEVERFLKRERELGRTDLILPVYYISARELDDAGLREADAMAQALASRQYSDWRELRFEPLTSPVVRKAIAQLAARMSDTFWRPGATVQTHPVTSNQMGIGASTIGTTNAAEASTKITAKSEPPIHIVDSYQRGNFVTVSEAIEAAKPGDRILVRPGLYEESVVIDKPLEVLGDGPVSDIEIRARDSEALSFHTSIGRVTNLTLRQANAQSNYYGVKITQGRLDLEGCDISSQGSACVAIYGGADPRLRRNRIHDGRQSGVFVYDDGLGTLEDNDITDNAYSGVEVKTGANPTLRRNQISNNKTGAYIHSRGLGIFEDNDITANIESGVEIETNGRPTLRANRINQNQHAAITISKDGGGVMEDNDLTSNSLGAWSLAEGGGQADIIRANNKE